VTTGGLLSRALRLEIRSDRVELMDTTVLPRPVADRTLRFLEMANRRFGGTAIILKHLERWRLRWPRDRAITVLDAGTGAADIPKALVAWARARETRVHVTAVDMAADIVEVARARIDGTPDVVVERATLADVAASGRRFDYVIASLFLHHVPAGQLRETLLAIDGLAARGVVIGDLVRSPAALVAVGALAAAAGNAIVRHDGPLSVRRAFTVQELANLAEALGLRYLRARPEGVVRLSLAGEKEAADA
jgi:2-polyprenyl-3-methyl-5-hydroxy-6-metoxy-1,4-benzoquinol methylase